MSKKRNIDQLFQDQLSQFEATPSPEVWSKIETRLKKEKEDRKVIPLWWKLGGVAAVLALLLTLGDGLFNSTAPKEIVVEDATVPIENIDPIKDTTKEFKQVEEGVVNSEISPATQDGKNTLITETEGDKERMMEQKGNTPTGKERITNPLRTTKYKVPVNSDIAQEEIRPDKAKSNPPLPPQNSSPIPTGISDEGVAAEKIPASEKVIGPVDKNQEIFPKEEIGIADEVPSSQKTEVENPSQKKSIFEAIEENKKSEIAVVNEKKVHSWEVTPNVGPVYYSSLNGGSSINPGFSDNSQKGEVNFSYGVQVSYNINDRFSVRSGVNNVNVGYATGGIEIASGPASFGLKTVDYSNPGRNVISAFDKGTIPNNSNDPNNPYGALNLKSTSGNAEIRQSISYYEVPLEAKYVLLNSRFGINMIGGFSTLFLNGSEVSVNDGSFRSVLGESNNLNSLSFSTNLGLGFDYKLSSKLRFNVEPMFKYQLNPYTDNSIDFRPYYFGIYSGLSFKF